MSSHDAFTITGPPGPDRNDALMAIEVLNEWEAAPHDPRWFVYDEHGSLIGFVVSFDNEDGTTGRMMIPVAPIPDNATVGPWRR